MDGCKPLVHGHKSPWKKFEWHVKPQYLVYALNADKTDRRQGLTLVHISAHIERFVWDRSCAQGLCSPC